MEQSKRTHWKNLAVTHINLRYPTISLNVNSQFNFHSKGSISLSTFVSNKEGNRLTLVSEQYEVDRYADTMGMLKTTEEHFNNKCKLVEDNFIFNEEWSIKEPYGINIINKNKK
jgi:hypothetical protein